MQEKNAFRLWRETVSSPSRFRDTFRGMHLAVLHQAVQQKLEQDLLFIQFEIQDFLLCEWKGSPADMTNLELPVAEGGVLWLCMQFYGHLSFPNGSIGLPETFFSFLSAGEDNHLTVSDEKTWVLFLGISGASKQQLLSEQPLLRQHYDRFKRGTTPARSITYVERQALVLFSKLSFGSFTTLYHIGQLLGKMYVSYIQQLVNRPEQGKEEAATLLYHKAIAYVQQNYLNADLNRMTVSEALHCSTRNLSRAFEGRTNTLNSTILLIRLYKGRELLRDRPELTVDEIAGLLHFPNAKHFAAKYKKCFHRSPREERKNISGWK